MRLAGTPAVCLDCCAAVCGRRQYLACACAAAPDHDSASCCISGRRSPTDRRATSTLHEDARLVNVPVTVYDKKGELVQNLTKDNFVLQVDKTAQTIRYFNLDTDLPLSLGLLVDTSTSQRDAIDDERAASSAFLDDMLNGPADRDKAFVIQFARETDLLQDTTSSKPKLQAALKQLQTSPEADESRASVTPVARPANHGLRGGCDAAARRSTMRCSFPPTS